MAYKNYGFKPINGVVAAAMLELNIKSVQGELDGVTFNWTHESESGIESEQQATVTEVNWDGKWITIWAKYCVGDSGEIDMYTTMKLQDAITFARNPERDWTELDWLT